MNRPSTHARPDGESGTGQARELRFLLLGRFALRMAADPPMLIRVSAKKSRALLAYLSMHPEHSVSREQLAALLWGDTSDKVARHNLRQCLASLRGELPPALSDLLIVEGDFVGLQSGAFNVDALELAAAADSADVFALERAVALYRGPFLAGLNVDSPHFDDWVRAEASRIETIAAHIFAACAERSDAAGRGPQAIDAIERLTALDPLREDWQRLALRLYARYRGREAALSQARRLTALLRSELDVAPEPATVSLIEDIKRGAVTPVLPIEAGSASAHGETGGGTGGRDLAAPESADQESADQGVTPARVPIAQNRPFAIAAGWSRSMLATAGLFSAALVILGVCLWWIRQPPATTKATDFSGLRSRNIVPVAVLPFTTSPNASEDEKIFADALADDLIAGLSRFAELRLISRQTSLSYRDRSIDVTAIGAALGVRYVVDGSIQSQDARTRVSVRLVDAVNRLQPWTDRLEVNGADRFDIRDDIIKRLGREIQVALIFAKSRRAVEDGREPTVDEFVAQGWAAIHRGPFAGSLAEARSKFAAALERDPGLVSAMVGAAAERIVSKLEFLADPASSLQRAEELLDLAIERAPDWAVARYWLGQLQKARGQYDAALLSFRRSLELNPSLLPAYAQIANLSTAAGHPGEAGQGIQYALQTAPYDPEFAVMNVFAGSAELELGHDTAALEWYQRAAALWPGSPNVHRCLAAAYALAGDNANAVEQASQFKKLADPQAWAAMLTAMKTVRESGDVHRPRLLEGLDRALAWLPK
jgi:DNA-binding SARP family transcriptional activator/TolB-like protein/Tfp pilus assembly protein PilF